MELAIEREELFKKYLLGELAEEQRTEIEIGALTDRDYFNELLLIEGELTDDFVFGALSDYEHHRMTEYVLAVPQLRQKLSLTKLIALISEPETDTALDSSWEETLREAQQNRELLFALMDSDWRGLQLLMLLEAMPQGKDDISAQLHLDEEAVMAPLSKLMQAGAIVISDDLFWCTSRGSEGLQRIQVLLTPETPNGA